jgi:mannose-6-phosphate isomerase-like protein (cupin superfamily)
MATKIRRVVTGHDKSGKAIVLKDGAPPKVVSNVAGVTDTVVWVTDTTPAVLVNDKDNADRQIGVPPPLTGSIFRTVEFPPDKDVPAFDNAEMTRQMGIGEHGHGEKPRHPGMHRTQSIDYAIVLKGEIDMLLDDSEVRLREGDVVVQQGTNHAWANRGDKPCLVAFVLIGANKP